MEAAVVPHAKRGKRQTEAINLESCLISLRSQVAITSWSVATTSKSESGAKATKMTTESIVEYAKTAAAAAAVVLAKGSVTEPYFVKEKYIL